MCELGSHMMGHWLPLELLLYVMSMQSIRVAGFIDVTKKLTRRNLGFDRPTDSGRLIAAIVVENSMVLKA